MIRILLTVGVASAILPQSILANRLRSDTDDIARALGYNFSSEEALPEGVRRILLVKAEPDPFERSGGQSPSTSASGGPPPKTHPVYIELIAVPTRDRSATVAALPWTSPRAAEGHHERIDLGTRSAFHWFGDMSLYGQEFLRSRVTFQGGDERLGLLIRGLSIDDAGTATRNTCAGLLACYGDSAVPALERVLFGDDKQAAWYAGIATGGIETDEATKLLIRAYECDRLEVRQAATYGLVHRPYRRGAERAYLRMLRDQVYVDSACEAVVKFQWKQAVPALGTVIEKPRVLRHYRIALQTRRSLEGNPFPASLLTAESHLLSAVFRSGGRDLPAADKHVLLAATDREAVLAIAVSLLTTKTKANVQGLNGFGLDLLKSQPRRETVVSLQKLARSLSNEEDRKALEKALDDLAE